jgi:hypothetical protein
MSKTVVRDQSAMTGAELYELVGGINYGCSKKPREVYRAELQAVVDEMNKRLKAICKKHGKRYKPFTIADIGHKIYL